MTRAGAARSRDLVAAWQAGQPAGTEARVLRLQGTSLEASTAPQDVGEQAAPRRLARDEKPLFDRAQRLRAAVAGNREGGAAKPEVEVERLPGGGLRLAAPLEEDGQVVGMVQLDLPAAPAPAPLPWWPPLAVGSAVLALFALLVGRSCRPRAWLYGLVAALFFAAGLAAVGARGGESPGAAATAARRWRCRPMSPGWGARRPAAGGAGAPARAAARPGALGRRPAAPAARAARRPTGRLDQGGAGRRRRREGPRRRRGRGGGRRAGGPAGAGCWSAPGWREPLRAGAGGPPPGLRLRRAGHGRHDRAGLLPVLLRHRALASPDSNIYNTDAPLTELWIGLRNYGAILADFGIARRGADGSAGLQLPQLLLDVPLHGGLDDHQRHLRRHASACCWRWCSTPRGWPSGPSTGCC